MWWELLTSLTGPITNAFQRRGANRVTHAKDRAALVEAFLTSHFRFLDGLGGILSVWGPDAPFTEAQARRAHALATRMEPELAKRGLRAREHAELVDAKLAGRLSETEGQGVVVLARTAHYGVGVTVAPLLRQIEQAKTANRAAATRLRRLQL